MPQDPEELLRSKHEHDEEKREFTNFARSVSENGHSSQEQGEEFVEQGFAPDDDQNRMKSVENRRIDTRGI